MREFWPLYLQAHQKPLTRRLHFIGTTNLFVLLAVAAWRRSPTLAVFAVMSSYAFAWFGHFVVERNVPTTFRHPWQSTLGDLVMYARIWSGALDRDLEELGLLTQHERSAPRP
jgi:hypothetical protein